MITEALLHCPGIGPRRLGRLHERNIRSWNDIQARRDELPSGLRDAILHEVDRCVTALDSNDISYFVSNFHPKDRWRILAHYLNDISCFDIETTDLEYDARITVIVCWHENQLHSYVEHENLDDFLELLDDVRLLVSFNGSSFDVPRVLDSFHIPALPCPHLDLRWLCYHHGYSGGLKRITRDIGIARPHDLAEANGQHAIQLWNRWQTFADRVARDRLVRYCGSDVLLLPMLAHRLLGRHVDATTLWKQLPTVEHHAHDAAAAPDPVHQSSLNWVRDTPDTASQPNPSRLRGLRRPTP